MIYLNKHIVIIIIIVTLIPCVAKAQLPGKYVKFNINNISTHIFNNGLADVTSTQNSGLLFPQVNKQSIVFCSGFVWGGKIEDKVRMGGSIYYSGLQSGKILENGNASDPESESSRVYRVRPDYFTSDFITEINDGEGVQQEIFSQYKKDWDEWPANDGAPFMDINKDGIYNPLIDIPGIKNADQTLWFVANDLDSNLSKILYGTLPTGVELQVTVWGYSNDSELDNMVFKKYKIINKSQSDINDTYISIWSDFEIGDSENDYSGCDTLLNLGYMYNKEINDDYIFTTSVPAIGNCLLQGPIVPGQVNDVAYRNGKQIIGKINLPMTSTHYLYPYEFIPRTFSEPVAGDYKNGALLYYKFMQGRIEDSTFHPIPVEFGGGVTKFPLSGDPVTGEGFLDGIQQSWGDRSIGIGSGPFELAIGDTQEVVFVEIAALGDNNINSISILKEYSRIAKGYFTENLLSPVPNDVDHIPVNIALGQNYPNPFNPVTKFNYTIPSKGKVKIIVTNILGQDVQVLVDEFKNSGSYEIEFKGENLSSGVYYYRLEVGDYSISKKMVLVK